MLLEKGSFKKTGRNTLIFHVQMDGHRTVLTPLIAAYKAQIELES